MQHVVRSYTRVATPWLSTTSPHEPTKTNGSHAPVLLPPTYVSSMCACAVCATCVLPQLAPCLPLRGTRVPCVPPACCPSLRHVHVPLAQTARRAPAPPPPTAPTPPPTSLRNTDVRRRHRVPSHTCGASFPPTNCGPLRLSQVIQRLRRCREAVSQVGPSRAPWSPECRLRRSTRAGGFPSRASPTSRSSRGDQICRLGCPWVSIWMAPMMMARAESPWRLGSWVHGVFHGRHGGHGIWSSRPTPRLTRGS